MQKLSIKMRYVSLIIINAILISFVFSCNNINVYEKNKVIPNHNWQAGYVCADSFLITDTTSVFNIYITIRHTEAYHYNNIWLNLGLTYPGDTAITQKVNLVLGNDATGWAGTGMDDIWDVKKKLNSQPFRFRKIGYYHYRLSHIMREDPLEGIMSAGLRLEKTGN